MRRLRRVVSQLFRRNKTWSCVLMGIGITAVLSLQQPNIPRFDVKSINLSPQTPGFPSRSSHGANPIPSSKQKRNAQNKLVSRREVAKVVVQRLLFPDSSRPRNSEGNKHTAELGQVLCQKKAGGGGCNHTARAPASCLGRWAPASWDLGISGRPVSHCSPRGTLSVG